MVKHKIIARHHTFMTYTYLYASQDKQQDSYAKYMKNLGARTLDISKMDRRLLTQKSISIPQLYPTSKTMNSNYSYEGWFAVKSLVQLKIDAMGKARKGVISLIIIMTYVLLGLLSVDTVKKWIMVYPIALLFCLPILLGNCPTCSTQFQYMTILSVTGMSLVTVIGIMVFWIGWRPWWIRTTLLLLGAAAPIMSALSVAYEPKLCPACIIGGIACFASGIAHNVSVKVNIPRQMKYALVMVFALYIAVAMHVQASDNTSHVINHGNTSFLGHSSDEYGIRNLIKPYQCVVVSNPLCGACKAAMKDLSSIHVNPKAIYLCSIMKTSQCFQWNEDKVATPIILVFDNNNKVIFQAFGWPIPKELQLSLVSLLRNHHI